MAERDARDEPKPLAVVSGIAAEGRAQTAYRVYLNHMRDCEECSQSLFQCQEAADRWKLYLEARR
ncbi:hypothetical protein SAMN05216223_107253 [Actinacidiphila yanglinensis]|uniref:Uncharacterized protein n=1 Tax=Actinacidiphila yanglinensis TaxID=310779 RepID=A0A1H6BUI3_9ACTN|nr:hypothetical protein SAMN05216223_107253 [Actinacidiphila yanglinensis]